MSNVEFDEERSINSSFTSHKIFGDPVEPGIARFLRKAGVVKTGGQAKWVMFAIIVVCFVLAIYIFIKTYLPPQSSGTPQEIQLSPKGKTI